MAFDRARAQQNALRIAKSGPARLRGPVGRATRRFRGGFSGPLVTVVLPVSDDETTRIDPMLHSLRAQTHRNLDVVVVPYGRHDDVVRLTAAHVTGDWRIRLRRPQASLAQARNAGVAAARGALIVVVNGGDDLTHDGIGLLVGAHQRTASPLVVGRMLAPLTVGWVADAPYDAAHRRDLLRTSLAETPVAITDLGLGNKLFTSAHWSATGARFTDEDDRGTDVVLALLASARSLDLLKEPSYIPTGRRDGVGVGTMSDVLSTLDAWSQAHRRTWAAVDDLGRADVRSWWLWGVLDTAIQPLVADVERADDRQWDTLQELVRLLLDGADDDVWARLSAESRVKLWLLQQGHRAELEEFAAERLFTGGGNRPTEVRDGRVWAQLPFHDDTDLAIPAELFEMTEDETHLRGWLREVHWAADDQIELTIFAAIDFVHMTDFPQVACALVEGASGARFDLEVRPYRDWRANQNGRRHQDFSWGAFVATVPARDLAAAASAPGTWLIDLMLTVDGLTRTGPVATVDLQGSAGFMAEDHLAPRPVGDWQIGFTRPTTLAGVRVLADRGPRLLDVTIADRTVSGRLRAGDRPIDAVRVSIGSRQIPATSTTTADTTQFTVTVPSAWTGQSTRRLEAVLDDGSVVPVGWPVGADQWIGVGDLVASRAAGGGTELREAAGAFAVDEVALDGLVVTATGTWLAGSAPAGSRFELTGGSERVVGVADPTTDGRVAVSFELQQDPWGLGASPLPMGIYWLRVVAASGSHNVLLGSQGIDQLHRFVVGSDYTLRVLRNHRSCGIELMRALPVECRGPFGQQSLQDSYAATDLPLDETSVYLQSYAGASATDSQLAIHEELRRVRPDLTIHWGVTGPSSWVPEGGVPVTLNSPDWYRVLATAKYLCLNIDPERWFDRRPGQRLLQTFHGYPAKSMGLRMWRAKHYTQKRIDLELARTSGEWDLILTPAPAMDEHYRREYAYDGPILSEGYPRDDDLVTERREQKRRETRERLGIRPDQKAVLYAPTWRDDLATNWRTAEMVKHLDIEAASRALGPDYVLLVRGHRFHAPSVARQNATARFIDVTAYPEINDLIAASDAAVLDYSSLRFDFALTGKPMIFLVPDLDTYVGGVRGFLYDYRDSAPGPLVDTADEAVRLLRDYDGLVARCAPEIERFNAAYNHLQDGRSAQRVVAAFFADDVVGG